MRECVREPNPVINISVGEVEERNGESGWGRLPAGRGGRRRRKRCRAEIRTVDRQKLNNRAEPPGRLFLANASGTTIRLQSGTCQSLRTDFLRFPFPFSFSPAPSLSVDHKFLWLHQRQQQRTPTYVPPIGGHKDVTRKLKEKRINISIRRSNGRNVGICASADSIGNLLDHRKTKNLGKLCRWIRFKRWRSTITASCLPSLFRAGTSSGQMTILYMAPLSHKRRPRLLTQATRLQRHLHVTIPRLRHNISHFFKKENQQSGSRLGAIADVNPFTDRFHPPDPDGVDSIQQRSQRHFSSKNGRRTCNDRSPLNPATAHPLQNAPQVSCAESWPNDKVLRRSRRVSSSAE